MHAGANNLVSCTSVHAAVSNLVRADQNHAVYAYKNAALVSTVLLEHNFW